MKISSKMENCTLVEIVYMHLENSYFSGNGKFTCTTEPDDFLGLIHMIHACISGYNT